MLVTIFVVFIFSFLYRAYMAFKQNKIGEVWIDGLLVNLFANLIFVGAGYYFREDVYQFFQRLKISMGKHCTKTNNDMKFLYDCTFTIKNERESELKFQAFSLASSATYNNHNFVVCNPTFDAEKPELIVETKAPEEPVCNFRVSLGPYKSAVFNLKINGDSNEPDPAVLQ